jgi:2-keto-3-deoxy-L-rhamnonate aldolase RhmA
MHTDRRSLELDRAFRHRLRAGETLTGMLCTLGSPDAVEVLAGCGFEWLFLDGEHGTFDDHGLRDALRAAGSVPCLVRVPSLHGPWIARALDAGATGVIVPQVHSAADAAAAVAAARHPPHGRRGIGPGRAGGYGSAVADAVARAERETVVVVQAESGEALTDIEAIARVPGLDAVLVGPADLSASLGYVGQPGHPEVTAAITRIAQACATGEVRAGIFAATPEGLLPWRAAGMTLLCAGVDTMLLADAGRRLAEALHRAAIGLPPE